jgi:hypothetical protein
VLMPKRTIVAALLDTLCIVRCMVDRQVRLSSGDLKPDSREQL